MCQKYGIGIGSGIGKNQDSELSKLQRAFGARAFGASRPRASPGSAIIIPAPPASKKFSS